MAADYVEARKIASAVLWFAPSGGIVRTTRAEDSYAIYEGVESLVKVAQKRHRRFWAQRDAGQR